MLDQVTAIPCRWLCDNDAKPLVPNVWCEKPTSYSGRLVAMKGFGAEDFYIRLRMTRDCGVRFTAV